MPSESFSPPFDLRRPSRAGVEASVPWGLRIIAAAAFLFFAAWLPLGVLAGTLGACGTLAGLRALRRRR